MRIGVTPRFEVSPHDTIWYVLEPELLGSLKKAVADLSFVLLTPESRIKNQPLDLIVFPGGSTPGENRARDEFEELVFSYGTQTKIPMIGICRGAQLFATLSGSVLEKVEGHINSNRQTTNNQLLGRCFHSWGINSLDRQWRVVSRDAEDNSIELFLHESLPILGVMAHPERHPEGVEVLKQLLGMIL